MATELAKMFDIIVDRMTAESPAQAAQNYLNGDDRTFFYWEGHLHFVIDVEYRGDDYKIFTDDDDVIYAPIPVSILWGRE